MRSSPFRLHPSSFILLILLFATSLRFFRIEHQSYWNDEGNSRALAGDTAPEIIRAAAADIHPPGYYLALKAWRTLVGESELALRGFSTLAGVVLVALLYRLGRSYFGARAGLWAALFGAVNPFLIYYSQEARMYSLLATLSAGSFLLFSAWLRSWRNKDWRTGEWRLGVGYVGVTALGLYTHYSFPFVVIAQNLALIGALLFHRRANALKQLIAWLILQFSTLILFLPWLPIAFRQLTTWPAAREFHSFSDSLIGATRYLAFGRTLTNAEAGFGLLAVGALVLLGLRRGQSVAPLLWLLVPAGLTLAFGLMSEAFSKFLLVAVPPWCLLMGNAYSTRHKGQGARRKGVSLEPWILDLGLWVLGLGVFTATALSLTNLYFNPAYFRDDYRGIARYVESLARPDDAILTLSPNQVQAFEYYHRAGAPVFPLPHSRPPDVPETIEALEDLAATHARVFVLWWGEEQADPERIVENWLSANAFKADDRWFGAVRLSTYALAHPAASPSTALAARFGESITLTGYSLSSASIAPGDILQLTLFWQTRAPLDERYKVFVHLYSALDAPPVAQHDGEPGGGRRLTSEWPVGEIIADNHGLLIPADLPPGEYTLALGLYNLFTGERLPITLGGDRLELQTIVVSGK